MLVLDWQLSLKIFFLRFTTWFGARKVKIHVAKKYTNLIFSTHFLAFLIFPKKKIDFYTKNPTHCPNLGIDLFAKDFLFCLDKFGTKKSEQFKSTHLYRVSAKKLFLSQKCHIPTEGVLRHKGDSQTLFFLWIRVKNGWDSWTHIQGESAKISFISLKANRDGSVFLDNTYTGTWNKSQPTAIYLFCFCFLEANFWPPWFFYNNDN